VKLIVVPERDREIVTEVVHDVIVGGHRGGTENLTLTIMRRVVPPGWSVRASGLGDPVLEAGYSDVVSDALQRALP
jgi:hypothetical protein